MSPGGKREFPGPGNAITGNIRAAVVSTYVSAQPTVGRNGALVANSLGARDQLVWFERGAQQTLGFRCVTWHPVPAVS